MRYNENENDKNNNYTKTDWINYGHLNLDRRAVLADLSSGDDGDVRSNRVGRVEVGGQLEYHRDGGDGGDGDGDGDGDDDGGDGYVRHNMYIVMIGITSEKRRIENVKKIVSMWNLIAVLGEQGLQIVDPSIVQVQVHLILISWSPVHICWRVILNFIESIDIQRWWSDGPSPI